MRILRIAWVLIAVACGHHSGNTVDGNGGDDGDGGPTCDPNDPICTGGTRTFAPASLIIPMDLSYQATGMFQAYGLVYQLLAHDIHVYWLIDPNKTYHPAACNSAASPCAWDCGVEGSGVKCTYPTSSPDFAATTNVIWDDTGAAQRGSALGTHKYRGGPFAIDAANHDAALAIIDAWNDQAKWAANPWAMRSVFHVVSVHEAAADFTANVARTMLKAPTIAVFADGNEQIATGYLRAGGIPQSSGAEFPMMNCGQNNCGPSTANPDMLTEEAIMGPLGTCAAPDTNHHNGALFESDGTPAYCQIMSMHWDVNARETVKCERPASPVCAAYTVSCGNAKGPCGSAGVLLLTTTSPFGRIAIPPSCTPAFADGPRTA